ncbi:nucleotidyltransferase family protein [Paenibacillus sp. NPDC057967]|uniref:nucleotidyltransferase family protein n=1 Tax=Paenibacillus sp. NPDC057967 TaxID=3346293 RepID=UPI0036D9C019
MGIFKTENRLVLLISKTYLTELEADELCELLNTHMDWSHVIGQLEFHRTAGIAWINFKKYMFRDLNFSCTCTRFHNYLKKSYLVQEKQVRSNLEYTSQICKLFDDHNIRYVILKGIVLSHSIYEDFGMRSFSDNDILVHPNQLNQAIEVLQSQGYIQGEIRQGREIVPASRRELVVRSMNSHEVVPFVLKIEDYMFFEFHIIDLHFSMILMSSTRNEAIVQEMLNSSIEINVEGKVIRSLPWEYMLLFLCQHLFKEAISPYHLLKYKDFLLYKFCDIYSLLKNPRIIIDWDLFIEKAYELDFVQDTFYTFHFLTLIFGEDLVPPEIMAKIESEDKEFLYEICKYNSNEVVYRYDNNVLDRLFDLNRPSKFVEFDKNNGDL